MDEIQSHVLTCDVTNDGIQTDTVWSHKNYKGEMNPQKIIEDDIFQISGDSRPLSSKTYENYLNISDCALKELDGVTVYCGSHMEPYQANFMFKVCGE